MFQIPDGSDYITIVNNEIGWKSNGIYTTSSSNTGSPSYYNFSNNYIHNIGIKPSTRNGDAHCVGIQGGRGGVIKDNYCYNVGTGPGLYAFTNQELRDTVIEGNFVNLCHNILVGSNRYGVFTSQNNDGYGNKTGNKFINNIIRDCPVGIRFTMEDSIDVYGNLVYNTSDWAFRTGRSINIMEFANGLAPMGLIQKNTPIMGFESGAAA